MARRPFFHVLALAAAIAPSTAACQEDDERIVISVPHGNFGADNYIAMEGELEALGRYRVELSWQLDVEDSDIHVTSTFGSDAVFSLDREWEISGLPTVFERNGTIVLFIPLELHEGRCGFRPEEYRLEIPLNVAADGNIHTAIGCDSFYQPVPVRRD